MTTVTLLLSMLWSGWHQRPHASPLRCAANPIDLANQLAAARIMARAGDSTSRAIVEACSK